MLLNPVLFFKVKCVMAEFLNPYFRFGRINKFRYLLKIKESHMLHFTYTCIVLMICMYRIRDSVRRALAKYSNHVMMTA